MTPLVSIVLSARNAEVTLEDALRSILHQTSSDYEVIFANDGSTDRTLEIAKSYANDRWRILNDGTSLGLPRRLNQCIELAKGRFIARMDADDIMHPERLSRQVEVMLSDTSIDVMGTDAWIIDSNSRILWRMQSQEKSTDPRIVLERGVFIHPTVFGRTEWFRTNSYSERYPRAEDHELWVRTCAHSRFIVLHEPLLYHRFRDVTEVTETLASGATTDRMILEYGARTGRKLEAYSSVLRRSCRRLLFLLGATLGPRKLKWWFKGLLARNVNFEKAQQDLAFAIKPHSHPTIEVLPDGDQ